MDLGSTDRSDAPAPDGCRGTEPSLRDLFDRLPVGVFRTTPDGRLVEANPALLRISGFPSRQAYLSADAASLWVNPDERARWRALMERDGEVRDFEFLHRRYDGTAVWVRATTLAVRGEDGAVVAYEGVLEDVTERKAARDRARFEADLLAGLREALSATDLRGNVTYWNEAAARMFGVSAEEALGKSVLDVCVAEHLREEGAAILAGTARGESYSGEFMARRRGGAAMPILLSVSPIRDLEGNVVGTVGICSDLTQQKRTEEVQRFLAEAGSVLGSSLDYETVLASVARLAVPTLADWCFVDVVEDDGTIRRVVSAHVDPRKEELSRALLRLPPSPDGPNITSRVIRTGRTWWMEEVPDTGLAQLSHHPEHLRVLREMAILSGIAVPLVARGRTLGVLRFATQRGGRRYGPDDVRLAEEVGRRVALAVDNARLFHQAQSALAAREQILRVVSHDLRNPLGAVLAHADMLLAMDDAPADARRAWAEVIRSAGEQMSRMIRDLLDASQLESGRLPIEPAPCAAAPLLREAVLMLRPIASAKDLSLTLAAADDLPGVHADRQRVLQVLSNLIGNAIKFTPAGGSIEVRARAAAGEVRFSVADTGPGVGADEISRIFEPFWRGRNARRDGIGLGLTIARWLVEAHGGRIWAENADGGGAVFHFTLPQVAASASPVAA